MGFNNQEQRSQKRCGRCSPYYLGTWHQASQTAKKKGGKTSGAEYRAPMFEGDDGILYFNELRERDYKSYKEKKMQYRSGAQDNTFLHELGHHIDALLEPKAYSMVEHQWNMEKVNKELIEKELSRYALENRAEFEAELISATLRGKTFSKELLSYSNLHNPEQNEGIAKTCCSMHPEKIYAHRLTWYVKSSTA